MKSNKLLKMLIMFMLLIFVYSCKKNKIDTDMLKMHTWRLNEVVLLNSESDEEYNVSSDYLYEKCDTILLQFTDENLFLQYDLCTSPDTFIYSFNKKENLITVTYENGKEYLIYRIDELSDTRLKLVFMGYNINDELIESGMAWYFKPE